MGLVLHESEHPPLSFQKSARIANLRLAVLEWPYREENLGPPLKHRIRPEYLQEMAEHAGLSQIKTIPFRYLSLYLLDH